MHHRMHYCYKHIIFVLITYKITESNRMIKIHNNKRILVIKLIIIHRETLSPYLNLT